MKQKLKYINLFEELSLDEIPFLKKIYDLDLPTISFPVNKKNLPEIYNELTNEDSFAGIDIDNNNKITHINSFNKFNPKTPCFISISKNSELISIKGFESLKTASRLYLDRNPKLQIIDAFESLEILESGIDFNYNPSLISIKGFDSLIRIKGTIDFRGCESLVYINTFKNLKRVAGKTYFGRNLKLILMSIPNNLIKAITQEYSGIRIYEDGDYFGYHDSIEFINDEYIIQDCIDKFDPELHSGVVVTQIVENLELWGTDETKESVYSHIGQNGNPEHIEHLPDIYRYLYDPKHSNTGAKSVAKVATGVTYGLF